MKTHKLKIVFNVIGFKLSWLACVFGAVWGYPYTGSAIMVVYVIINSVLFGFRRHELLFIVSAAMIGTLIDSMKASTGLISYSGGYSELTWIAPLWITALWTGFAATINHSLDWLRNRVILSFTMGAVFGPLAYIGGAKIGGVTLNYSLLVTIPVLSLVWGIVLPSFYMISKKLKAVSI